mmetsp:Transcript_124021/g.294446  ORF Transcript_124021/g.294446 Transcript_124021/m.294446 type:complete len:83 (-) Transcript_124021:13-261(-)
MESALPGLMSQWDLADTLQPTRIRSGKKQKIFGEVDTTPSGEAAKRRQKLGRSLRWSDGLQENQQNTLFESGFLFASCMHGS